MLFRDCCSSRLFPAEYREIAVFAVVFEVDIAESGHILGRDVKIKLGVFLYMLIRRCLGQRGEPELEYILYAELRGRYAVFCRQTKDLW